MIYKVIPLCILLYAAWQKPTVAQPDYWKLLEDVTYQNREQANTGFNITYPVFGPKVNELVGKQITLKGFMVPLDELTGKNRFVLSSLPFNICFFCGGAGPETVIEVYSQAEIDFTDDIIWIKGDFYTNQDNPEQLMYLLKNAELVKN